MESTGRDENGARIGLERILMVNPAFGIDSEKARCHRPG
jgi:hypothetical protein